MASEALSFVLLGHGSSCIIRPVSRLSVASPGRSILVYCKSRPRNQSPQQRRQQIKRVSPDRLPLKVKTRLDGTENDEVEPITSGVVLNSQQTVSSGNNASGLSSKEDMPVHLLEDTNILRADADAHEESQSVFLDDLVNMVKNAEQNILLLNHARVHALQELDKILLEKEALQAEINTLEMKLAETDARIKVAAQEKINAELLEDQLVKLKNDLSGTNATEGARDGLNLFYRSSNISDSPLLLEFDNMKKENELLKDDIETIKVKLIDVSKSEQSFLMLENECSDLKASIKVLESKVNVVQDNATKLDTLEHDWKVLSDKVENLQAMLEDLNMQKDQGVLGLQQNFELQKKVEKLEVGETNTFELLSEKFQHYDEFLQEKIKTLEDRLNSSHQDIKSYIQLYQESAEEFNDTLNKLKQESERSPEQTVDDMPWEFWSRLLLMVDGWLLEKKISSNDSKLLREMIWKRDTRIRDAYLACKGKDEREKMSIFLRCASSPNRTGLHIIQIAAEMAPVAKVGGLGDVVSGLGKALQRKGHLIELILPKYDCMQYDRISDLKLLDVVVQSYFEGQMFKNNIWVGIIEGLPVYFIEPDHPAKFFRRGKFYGDHDDFKRFSYFSRAALELLYQAGKRPDIIHCHDWQTAFVAPLYWEIFAPKGLDSARICFTCHNFEYQGTASASELAGCGLDVHHMNRPDRMQDNSSHDRVNLVKGAIVFSNIVTTVSPTYAEEVRTPEGGRGLHETLKFHSRKFVGILNGIDNDTWSPSTDSFLSVQYSADDLQGKAENKYALRKLLNLSIADSSMPLVGCITRLVPQKGVHLIRHAIYKTLELGGQFVLLGSSPVPHIQREFEGIANHFQSHSHARMLLKYDDALSHLIYGASDMFIIPSLFEPCGLTQMIAMRYGSVPIARKTGGLNDSVFDIDDNAVPVQYRNGFTFLTPDEQALNSAMERAFRYCLRSPESWQQLVQKIMRMDFSWDSSASQYEDLYEKSVARARARV